MVSCVNGINWSFQIADEDSVNGNVRYRSSLRKVKIAVLTHAAMVSLRPKQTVDEDDGRTLSSLALLWLIKIICHSHSIPKLGRGERSSRIGHKRLLQSWQRQSSPCEHGAP